MGFRFIGIRRRAPDTLPCAGRAGSDEPEIFRRQAEQFASLVPRATLKVWRGGGHCARNIPDALERAVDWLKEQLGPATSR